LHRTSEDRVDDVAVSQNELQAFAKLGGLIVELLLGRETLSRGQADEHRPDGVDEVESKVESVELGIPDKLGQMFQNDDLVGWLGKAACGNCPKILPSMEL
jgi:hypothetical protein